MGHEQKPKWSSSIVTDPQNLYNLLKTFYISVIAFSPHNIKILPIHQLEFLGVCNPT